MKNKIFSTKTSLALFVLALFLAPRVTFADGGDRHDRDHFYHYHDHPRFGLRVSFLPDGYSSFWVGGGRYYYYDGLYYNNVGGEYVIVSPPAGAVVNTIPTDFQPVLVNGVTYYVNNGTYYLYTAHGYQVAAPPVVTTVVAQDSFIVNVPNNSGGFTPVMIKRSGNGYLGPQGEFYPAFPKVVQLRTMYAK